MNYWNYNADSHQLVLYSRDEANEPMLTLSDVGFKQAHDIAHAVDVIYEQGARSARAEMWRQICSALGKT